jgi:putative isomerase
MVMLVYWGLDHPRYRGLPAVKAARAALTELSEALLLKEWASRGHVHENYDATTGEGDNVQSSDPFYHWGALLGVPTLLEREKAGL